MVGEVPTPEAQGPTVSNEIETVAFEQSTQGHPLPLLCFKGGYASFNVDQLVNAIDIAFDVVEHPTKWPAWRRTANGIERQTSTGWKALTYKYECAAQPRGTMLSGTFEHYAGTAIGDIAAVETRHRYRFSSDGSFQSCKSTLTAVVATGTLDRERLEHSGRYEVDGFTIRFSYADGSSETLPLFYDPTRPTRLWIGNDDFPSPTSNDPAICVAP